MHGTSRGSRVAVFGATGAVGRAMVRVLEDRDFPVAQLRLVASPRSAGQTMSFRGAQLEVVAVHNEVFTDIDVALFSAGADASRIYAPLAVESGAVVIDNSSAFRLEDWVPLVVPEVNPHALAHHRGIVANPNCSTIQLVVALSPLRRFGLKHVTISTYQAVSGMGQKAIDALLEEVSAPPSTDRTTLFPTVSSETHLPMAFNVLPQCDAFLENGYTREEMKLVHEPRKILEMPSLSLSPTAVRVPVVYGHSESVEITFSSPVTAADVRTALQSAPGVQVVDRPDESLFPHPRMAEGSGLTFVGRIRQDLDRPNVVHMFIVADNLLKGAAYNAVQIAEMLV
jgi:aspartate-semialdehyde dehydrogenase